MTENFERQTSKVAGWSRGIAMFSAVLLVTVWVGHHYHLVETTAFLWVLAIVALLAAFAVLLAGYAFSRLWSFGERGGRDLTVGFLVAILVLTPYAFAAYWVSIYPPLRDISTDLDDPPMFGSLQTSEMSVHSAPTPGEHRLQAQAYPLVTGRRYELPFDETVNAVESVLQQQGWQLVGPLPIVVDGLDKIVLNASATSFMLDLPVDVAIRISNEGETSSVDMRSASRFGNHDLGDNAERIVSFLAQLDQEVAEQAGVVTAQ